jgi:hypothetical protein
LHQLPSQRILRRLGKMQHLDCQKIHLLNAVNFRTSERKKRDFLDELINSSWAKINRLRIIVKNIKI